MSFAYAQKTTIKVKNNSEEEVNLYSIFSKDSVSLYWVWDSYYIKNTLFVASNKEHEYFIYPSPEYKPFFKLQSFEQKNMFSVYGMHRNMKQIKFFVAREEANDTIVLKEVVLPVKKAFHPIAIIGGFGVEFDFERGNFTPKDFFLENRIIEIYDECFNYDYKVTSVDMTIIETGQTFTTNSNKLSDEMLAAIMNLKPREQISFRVRYSYDNRTSSTSINRVIIK